MKKKWKLLLGLLIIVAIVAIVLQQYSQGIEARIVEIQPRTFSKAFKEEGKVISNDEYKIYTASGGKIVELPVKEGQSVEQGTLLLTFDNSELNFQLQQLQAQLKSIIAQYELEKSQISLDKMKELYEAGAISQKEYKDAWNTVNSQYYPGQIDALKAQIDMLQYKLDESKVCAPIDGIVSGLELKKGMIAMAGEHLMTIIQKSDYGVETYILTEDVANISNGMKVEIIQDNKGEDIVFTGEVEEIASSAIEKTSALGLIEQRIKVTIKFDEPQNLLLRPGYALDIQFTTQTKEDCFIVPKTALFPYQEGDALWVVRNNKAEVQKVTKSLENDREVVITKGLNIGDQVILNPQLEGLKEGTKITNIN
jgi:HlyD family secretion protein